MTVAIKCTDTCHCLKAWCWGAYRAYGSVGTLFDWPDWLLHLQFCGALFNLAKALGMQGKGSEAAEAYEQAAEVTLSSLLPHMRTHVQHVSQPSTVPSCQEIASVQDSKHRCRLAPAFVHLLGRVPWKCDLSDAVSAILPYGDTVAGNKPEQHFLLIAQAQVCCAGISWCAWEHIHQGSGVTQDFHS